MAQFTKQSIILCSHLVISLPPWNWSLRSQHSSAGRQLICHSVTQRPPLITGIHGHCNVRKQAWWFAPWPLSIPQKWHTSPPIILLWPKQIIWLWLASKAWESVILSHVQNKKTWKYLWTALRTAYGPSSLPSRKVQFRNGEWGFTPKFSFLSEEIALLVCVHDSLKITPLRRETLKGEIAGLFCLILKWTC